eukprot:1162002-Pelagomonas_calceolata.AAC.4
MAEAAGAESLAQGQAVLRNRRTSSTVAVLFIQPACPGTAAQKTRTTTIITGRPCTLSLLL